uniref:Uncharacterized protein n=1 Tax=Spermophilus dauricus TaxID=99837 RepID=A0A8C9PRV2_SPEDA
MQGHHGTLRRGTQPQQDSEKVFWSKNVLRSSQAFYGCQVYNKVPLRKALNSQLPILSLQSLLDQHKDFGAAFEPLQRKLLNLQVRIQAEKGLQRDLPGKQAQLLRLQVRGSVGLSQPSQG